METFYEVIPEDHQSDTDRLEEGELDGVGLGEREELLQVAVVGHNLFI